MQKRREGRSVQEVVFEGGGHCAHLSKHKEILLMIKFHISFSGQHTGYIFLGITCISPDFGCLHSSLARIRSSSTMVVQLGPEALTLIAQDLQSSSSKIAKVSQDAAADTTIIIQNILHFDELPKWMQVDPHIRQGYRPQLDSFRDCFWSLFYPHNELVNTWSHLLPAFFYLALLLGVDYLALHSNVKISAMDNLVFEVYVAGTFVCLFFSVSCLYPDRSLWGVSSHL